MYRLPIFAIVWSSCFAVSTTFAQAPSPVSIYPLDAVLTPSGDVVVVDRNLPGLRLYKGEQLSVLVQGSKRYREPLNALERSPSTTMARFW